MNFTSPQKWVYISENGVYPMRKKDDEPADGMGYPIFQTNPHEQTSANPVNSLYNLEQIFSESLPQREPKWLFKVLPPAKITSHHHIITSSQEILHLRWKRTLERCSSKQLMVRSTESTKNHRDALVVWHFSYLLGTPVAGRKHMRPVTISDLRWSMVKRFPSR